MQSSLLGLITYNIPDETQFVNRQMRVPSPHQCTCANRRTRYHIRRELLISREWRGVTCLYAAYHGITQHTVDTMHPRMQRSNGLACMRRLSIFNRVWRDGACSCEASSDIRCIRHTHVCASTTLPTYGLNASSIACGAMARTRAKPVAIYTHRRISPAYTYAAITPPSSTQNVLPSAS